VAAIACRHNVSALVAIEMAQSTRGQARGYHGPLDARSGAKSGVQTRSRNQVKSIT